MKKGILTIVALAIVAIASCAYVSNLRSQITYIDTPCPVCGSDEVLDFGINHDGVQVAYCYDCSLYFTIENR
mgnify:CR=1 FL=1